MKNFIFSAVHSEKQLDHSEDLQKNTLRKWCPYSELFWSVFSRIRTEYGEIRTISPYSVQMWGNTDQNNSKYGYFSCSDILYDETHVYG